MPSETLHRRDAVSELLLKNKDGFTASSLLSPKLSGIQIAEGVKPHQKLSAAGTLIDAAMDGFTACF